MHWFLFLFAWSVLALVGCTSNTGNTDAGPEASGCPLGQTSCGGSCVDTQNNRAHCGACGRACPANNAQCVAGTCVAQCEAPRVDCDEDVSTGCESDTSSSIAHCGACQSACPRGANSTPNCAQGRCGLQCETGFSDCDQYPDNGCESANERDVEHCGGCDRACTSPPQALPTCAQGQCGLACVSGFADCDRNMENGCEASLLGASNCGSCATACAGSTPYCASVGGSARCVTSCPSGTVPCGFSCVSLASDVSHCGACNRRCPTGVNAQAMCNGGSCSLQCRAGYADCDNDPRTGCETNLQRSTTHCGACGTACPSGPQGIGICVAGACVLRCAPGRANCDQNVTTLCETDLAVDAQHCGRCGRACPARANASVSCAQGRCGFSCLAEFANCDGEVTNGCEAFLRADRANCGACGNRCADGAVCSNGRCVASTCSPGRADCDGNASNGCETDVTGDGANCGACGLRCERANAQTVCTQGRCVSSGCNEGFGDCDGNPGNGCETRVASLEHCGACGRACALANALAQCATGVCAIVSCQQGYGDCDRSPANGCERSLDFDNNNCGACGRVCETGAVCRSGMCVSVGALDGGGMDASSGDAADAGSEAMEAGIDARNDSAMDAISDRGTDASMDGSMDAETMDERMGPLCLPDEVRCGSVCVNTQTSGNNCGSCGNVCAGGRVCTNGTCVCPVGQILCGTMCVNPNTTNTACGTACTNCAATGRSCVSGSCACPSGRVFCGGSCIVENNSACGPSCTNCTLSDSTCVSGMCRSSCNAPNTLCGTSCVDLLTFNDHCGMCNRVCGAGQTCCGGNCVDTTSSSLHCGACGNVCPSTTCTATCTNSVCNCGCTYPLADCNMNPADGCETNVRMNAMHCGACGLACTAGNLCIGGMCMP